MKTEKNPDKDTLLREDRYFYLLEKLESIENKRALKLRPEHLRNTAVFLFCVIEILAIIHLTVKL